MHSLISKLRVARNVLSYFHQLIWTVAPWTFLLSVFSGAMHRLVLILSYVISLKALMVSLDPRSSIVSLNSFIERKGGGWDFNQDGLIYFLAAVVFSVFVFNYVLVYFTESARCRVKRLIAKSLSAENLKEVLKTENIYRSLSVQDQFIYVKMAKMLDHYIKITELSLFIIMFFLVLCLFSWVLGVLTLGLSILISTAIVLLNKPRLQVQAKILNLKENYLASVKENNTLMDSLQERRKYIQEKQKQDFLKVRIDYLYLIFVGFSIALIIIISGSGFSSSSNDHTFYIFLIFSIRYIISYGRELGQALSLLLDFRPHLSTLRMPNNN